MPKWPIGTAGRRKPAIAMRRTISACFMGRGVPRDRARALKLYAQAAQAGNRDAQFLLGTVYAYGLAGVKDEALALTWFNKAARQGHVTAQFQLGTRYRDGVGVLADMSLADMWLRLAAEGGHPLAGEARAALEKKMSAAERREAERLYAETAAAIAEVKAAEPRRQRLRTGPIMYRDR